MARTQIDLSTQAKDFTLINDKIADNQITDSKINSSANISISKLNTTSADFDGSGQIKAEVISNSDINATANIDISKLNTTSADFDGSGQIKAGTIVDSDINASASISISKLNTTSSNFDSNGILKSGVVSDINVSAGASISYSKLNLSGSIVDSDISASAAISTTKLADGANFIKRDGSVVFIGDLSMGGYKISNLATPTLANDAATKGYVDGIAQSLDIKQSVRAVATSNILLSGLQTIDDVSIADGNRVLVAGQTNAVENGIYIASTGAWTRSSDMQAGSHAAGNFTFVEEGTLYADMGFVCYSNSASDLVGTNPLSFTQFSGAGQVIAGNGLTKTGNTLDIVAADSTIVIDQDSIRVNVGTGANQIVQLNASAKLPGVDGSNLVNVNAALLNSLSSSDFLRSSSNSSLSSGYTLSISSGAALDVLGSFKLNGADVLSSASELNILHGATVTTSELNNLGTIVIREVPNEATDGVRRSFTIDYEPISGSEEVFLNGILQEPTDDYTINYATKTITFVDAPSSSSRIRVSYRY